MKLRALWLAAIAACGGAGPHGAAEPRLVATIAQQTWLRSPSPCGQGPYELDITPRGGKRGEDITLRISTPHAIAIHANISVDGAPVAQFAGVVDRRTATALEAAIDNTRCVATAQERLQLGSAGAGGGGTNAGSGGGAQVAHDSVAAALVPEPGEVRDSIEVLSWRVTDPRAHVKLRWWSIEPNDLSGVAFGFADVTWAPNVSEDRYEAYLAEQLRAQQAHAAAEVERWQKDAPRRAREDAAEAERLQSAARRRAIAAALEADRLAAHTRFCDAHADDRDCWGPGGRSRHDELELHTQERARYCADHTEDARCWTVDDWQNKRAAWDARVTAALAPVQPKGPPPAPIAETPPPKLSAHAEWRAGYWQWTEGQWLWLAGMWRVPDSDIAAEQTTVAPSAPPIARVEPVPAPPVTVAVWVAGFWQWSGADWVWVPGSWQLRPDARAVWRAPEWRTHGGAHVLIPGRWELR